MTCALKHNKSNVCLVEMDMHPRGKIETEQDLYLMKGTKGHSVRRKIGLNDLTLLGVQILLIVNRL